MSTSSSIRFIVRSSLLSAIAVGALDGCTDVPNAPVSAERVRGTPPSLAKATPQSGPYTAVFDDIVSNKLRSDGQGPYVDSEAACVGSGNTPGGIYQLRTIRNTGVCKALHRGQWRFFKFDVGATMLDFDQDDLVEAIEDAPARLLADNAFAKGATSTPVMILILQVLPGDSTSQNHKWQIQYRANVSVTGSGTSSSPRVIQAFPGNAKVDIYDVNGFVVASNVDLPFKLSLTKQ